MPRDRLCEAPGAGGAAGVRGAIGVTAALCDGSQAVSLVRGSVKPGVSDHQLGADLRGVQAELFRVLYETIPPA